MKRTEAAYLDPNKGDKKGEMAMEACLVFLMV